MMDSKEPNRVVIGVTGASGSILAAKTIEKLISIGTQSLSLPPILQEWFGIMKWMNRTVNR